MYGDEEPDYGIIHSVTDGGNKISVALNGSKDDLLEFERVDPGDNKWLLLIHGQRIPIAPKYTIEVL